MKKKSVLIIVLYSLIIVVSIFVILFLVVLFPVRYKSTILKYSKVYNLNPEVVSAVINIESGFDKNAKSSVGAIGLMQLMPDTAIEIAEKLNVNDFTVNMLYSPEVNIRFGCYYLNYLCTMFDGNLTNALASYNAGFNKVKGWLENSDYSTNGVVVNPPILETRQYLDKFNYNLKVYKILL